MKYKLLKGNLNKLNKSGGFSSKKDNHIQLLDNIKFEDIKYIFSNPLLKSITDKDKQKNNSSIKIKYKNIKKGISSADFYIKKSRKKYNDKIFYYSNTFNVSHNNSEMKKKIV